MRPITDLEWIGLRVALRERLGISGSGAAILTDLMRRPEMLHTKQRLASVANLSVTSLPPILTKLRGELTDLGLPPILSVWREGYCYTHAGTEEVFSRLGV